jgi:hypothetical protein
LGSADLLHDVNGNRPGNRESGVPVPRDVTSQDELEQPPRAMHPDLTNVEAVICGDCGDNPCLDYSGVPARFQRLRGPCTLREGVAAHQQHLAEDYLAAGAR